LRRSRNSSIVAQVLENSCRNTLRKDEILRGRKVVSELFDSGSSIKGEFLRIVFASLSLDGLSCRRGNPLVLFVVGKKNVPSAVDRNRIKRLMREAYRHEKCVAVNCAEHLGQHDGRALCIALIYTGRSRSKVQADRFRKEVRRLLEAVRQQIS